MLEDTHIYFSTLKNQHIMVDNTYPRRDAKSRFLSRFGGFTCNTLGDVTFVWHHTRGAFPTSLWLFKLSTKPRTNRLKQTWRGQIQGLYSLSIKTSHQWISRNLEGKRFYVKGWSCILSMAYYKNLITSLLTHMQSCTKPSLLSSHLPGIL